MWWVLLACIDYSFESDEGLGLGVDTAEFENGIDGNSELDDTAIEEDTAEEAIDEEMVADAKVYANSSGSLYEINPETGESVLIGEFQEEGTPVNRFEDIAIDLSGHMYGGTGEFLYLINPATAAVRAVCPLDMATTALAFTSDDELIIGSEYSLYKMDIEDCTVDTLIAYSFYETSGDIVGLPDGYLYWSVRGGDEDQLVRVNPRTGQETWVGYIGENRLYGMGFSNDELFGFSGSGNIVGIDPETANSYILKEHDGMSWWGATTNPVVWN